MSTEARRASIPPRPAGPPRPEQAPATGESAEDGRSSARTASAERDDTAPRVPSATRPFRPEDFTADDAPPPPRATPGARPEPAAPTSPGHTPGTGSGYAPGSGSGHTPGTGSGYTPGSGPEYAAGNRDTVPPVPDRPQEPSDPGFFRRAPRPRPARPPENGAAPSSGAQRPPERADAGFSGPTPPGRSEPVPPGGDASASRPGQLPERGDDGYFGWVSPGRPERAAQDGGAGAEPGTAREDAVPPRPAAAPRSGAVDTQGDGRPVLPPRPEASPAAGETLPRRPAAPPRPERSPEAGPAMPPRPKHLPEGATWQPRPAAPVGGEPWSPPTPQEPRPPAAPHPATPRSAAPSADAGGAVPRPGRQPTGGDATASAPDPSFFPPEGPARAGSAAYGPSNSRRTPTPDPGPHADDGSRTPRTFRLPHDVEPPSRTSEAAGAPAASGTSLRATPSPLAPSGTEIPEPPRAAAPHRDTTHPHVPGRRPAPTGPPPPPASARFPDAPPAGPHPGAAHPAPPRRGAVPDDGITETTRRLRPLPATPPAGPPAPATPPPGTGRPYVSFAEPETSDQHPARTRTRPRSVAAAACLVLGLGLIGGAVTGSWLTGDSAGADGARSAFTAAGGLWHNVPVDQLFPPTVDGQGAGPGGADRTWTRIGVAPDSGCADAFDPLLGQALAPVGCLRLLRATYTDATHSQVTTVGLLFTKADVAAMTALKSRFQREGLGRRTDLMPRPYAVEDTAAAGFGDAQRASWTVSVLTDAPVVVYAVAGFADGRTVTAPQPAEDAVKPGVTTAPAQAGLGNDAQGLADRVERSLRKTVGSPTEKPS